MRKNMSYAVKSKCSPLWFQFNHHLSVSDGKRRHLGVLVVVLDKNVGRRQVEIFRNPRWKRADSKEVLGAFDKTPPDLSWERFAEIIHTSSSADADVRRVDDAFEGRWHAIPCGSDEDKDSWSYRDFWDWAVSTYTTTRPEHLESLPQVNKCRVSAMLIAYTPTPTRTSDHPVVFDVHASPGDTMFVAVYSMLNSGQPTRSWYWIRLKE